MPEGTPRSRRVFRTCLRRENVIQNKKCKCKNNIKLINLTFIPCTFKFEKHKQSFLSENYEQTFSNKGDD
jgi:hypothetical protein